MGVVGCVWGGGGGKLPVAACLRWSRRAGQPWRSPLPQHKRCSIASPKFVFLALFHHRSGGLHCLRHLLLSQAPEAGAMGEPCATGQHQPGVANADRPVGEKRRDGGGGGADVGCGAARGVV